MTSLEDDLRAALRAQAQALSVPERPALERDVVELRRLPAPRWLMLAACLVLILAGVVVLAQRRPGDPEPAPPVASVVPDTTAPALPVASVIADITAPPPSVASVVPESTVVEPSRFEDVHGWIAFRSGEDLVAVDPANPANPVSFGSSGGADPIGWSADGTQLLLRPHPELIAEFFDGGWNIGTSTTFLSMASS